MPVFCFHGFSNVNRVRKFVTLVLLGLAFGVSCVYLLVSCVYLGAIGLFCQ